LRVKSDLLILRGFRSAEAKYVP